MTSAAQNSARARVRPKLPIGAASDALLPGGIIYLRVRRLAKIAAHIGVLDEAGLIRPCIDHLRNIGVEEFIVCDMGSTDGTADILRSEEGKGFKILWSSNEEPGDEWLRRNTEAVATSSAGWMLLLDADEFPLPAGGDLHRALEPIDAEIVKVPRYNVVQSPGRLHMQIPPNPQSYGSVELYARCAPEFRERLAADTSLAWLRYVPMPKIILKPAVLRQLKYGMHDIIPKEGVPVRRVTATNIVTAHVALSDYDRFARKIENIRNMYPHHEGQLPSNFAWHWRRWLELANRGELRGEYDRSVLSQADLATLRGNGTIRSAASMLHGHTDDADHPRAEEF